MSAVTDVPPVLGFQVRCPSYVAAPERARRHFDYDYDYEQDNMKKRWNWRLWIGLVLVLTALLSYEFFAQFQVTRDFPWVNLLLFCGAGILLGAGLVRAFRHPEMYRGKIFGSVLAALSFLLFAFFAYEIFYVLRQVPRSAGAPKVG
jgi:hypothetical protein